MICNMKNIWFYRDCIIYNFNRKLHSWRVGLLWLIKRYKCLWIDRIDWVARIILRRLILLVVSQCLWIRMVRRFINILRSRIVGLVIFIEMIYWSIQEISYSKRIYWRSILYLFSSSKRHWLRHLGLICLLRMRSSLLKIDWRYRIMH
jgi:hypothetical protein